MNKNVHNLKGLSYSKHILIWLTFIKETEKVTVLSALVMYFVPCQSL